MSAEVSAEVPLLERVRTATGGQVEIRWYGQHGVGPAGGSPHTSEEQRTELRDAIAALRTRRQQPARPNHDRARAEAERHGADVLAKPDDVHASRVPWTVRIYYRSMGDEVLCFEATGLTERAAKTLAAAHRQIDAEVAGGRRRKVSAPGSDAHDAEQWPAHRPAPPIRHGARLVVLPSQRTDPVEVADGGDDEDLAGHSDVCGLVARERALELQAEVDAAA